MAKDFIFPPGTRYSCINCGRCCTHWAIKVEDSVAEKLIEYDWGAHYPDLKGYELFLRKKTGLTEGKAYFMRMRKNGRCPFLEENNFCRIHSDIGYDAKPAGCKLFPMSLVEGPRGIHARLSFYCPSIAANEGKSLNAQTRWISQCYRRSGAQALGDTLYLAEDMPIKYPDLLLLESNLMRILKQEGRLIQKRLELGGALIDALISNIENDDKTKVGNFLKDMEKLDYEPLMEIIGKPVPSPLRGRLALGLFLIQDTRPTAFARIARIPAILGFILKLGSLKSRVLAAKGRLGKILKVEFNPDDDSNELLIRFFEQKILGKRYVEGDLSVEGGWALLCAAYKLIELYSRLAATKKKRAVVERQDIVSAVGITDLLAVEHTVFFQMSSISNLVSVVLSQPGMYRNVLGAL